MAPGRPSATKLLLGAVCLVAVLAGCSVPARTVSDPVDPPAAFSRTGTATLPERWWTALEDEGLNRAIDQALTSNFDLRTAWERLMAARAVARQEAALLFPAVDVSADGAVRRTTGDAERDNAGVGDDEATETLQLGPAVAYEVDLWGRIRSSVQAERLRAQATFADYQTAALSLSAEIARTWAQLAEAQNQVALVESQIETNQTVLQLIENRFRIGLVQAVDVLRQRQLVEATREQRVIADADRQVIAHQLAVLLGRPPQEGPGMQPDSLPDLPPLPATGVPLDLVQRRPDVQSAFLYLQAADRDVAAAIRNQFPRLTLTASATSEVTAGALFQEWVTSFAGNLLAPIFYGGELRAEVDRTQAARQQRLFEYGQTVLVAFQEVEDALVLEVSQRARIGSLEDQLTLADQAYEQLRFQYLNGTSNYLEVLTALDEVQALRRDLLSARLTLVDQRIALYRALAGSFDAGSFDTAREVG